LAVAKADVHKGIIGFMPVYLSSAVVGNEETLVTLGEAGEIMAWFYPQKDHAQNIHECLPCVYDGPPGQGRLIWSYESEFQRHQEYLGDSNAVVTTLTSESLGLKIEFTDVVPDGLPVLLRQITLRHSGHSARSVGVFFYADWNMGGIRTGNSLTFNRETRLLVQGHHDVAAVIGGDAVEQWQCGKAGLEWGHNARHALGNGALWCQDLELGDVSFAVGFRADLQPGQTVTKNLVLAMGKGQKEAFAHWHKANEKSFEAHLKARRQADETWLERGLQNLKNSASLPGELIAAYKRSLLCLPLLTGPEGVALAAPEFDFEFISCGGYGYFWPRDGAEYLSGLIDAGYPEFGPAIFDWCAQHQDPSGLWHQRYFLNGEPGPNWCLPPDMLQIDQVGALLWGYGKYLRTQGEKPKAEHLEMVRRAADYLLSRLTEKGVHGNAFDTWETFVGSFTYSNAAIYAAFKVAHEVLGDEKYAIGAQRVKDGVLKHFVRADDKGHAYLVRGFNGAGDPDSVVDSASLGAIEPFGLLDLENPADLKLAEGTLREISHRLEVDWEGGRAIRRFEWDAYVGGVPACVNTLWMARCSLLIAARLRQLGRVEEANALTRKAQTYLITVLRRTTPTGLLPELMQGPTGQHYWAAPHGWAMSSFVSGVLMLAQQKKS
jgi:oligosaccharide amylase